MALKIYYDSKCPLCMWEMNKLKQQDHDNSIYLIDLHDEYFENNFPHIIKQDAMNLLHGQLDTGAMIYGLDVTVKAWQQVNKHNWLKILRWPFIRTISDIVYHLFARHRSKISYLFTGKSNCNC